ncbi:MAG: hypothetical protein JNM09_18320 [Blastocatellia bacterium]|nr:hypothetical protein [Blastocatellia bacterium]
MKFFATITIALSLLLTINAQPRNRRPVTTPQPAPTNSALNQLPLRRVILYSNGVAYFERRGTVTGRAEINLSFKQSQVDDVLKSLVVLDLGKGRIGAVSYNSSAPADARLREIPFSITAASQSGFGGMLSVLQQLQGAKVAITTPTRSATGAVLTVEENKITVEANKPPITIRNLVITTESGELQSFDLSEVKSVKLLDEGAKHDINEFANATASARRRDSKTITITSDGDGAREMIVSYTIAAPIWKTNYRVVLDADGKPFFQGWAIVDNVSEEDWSNVQLSLVSGTPISFIQPTQQPLYRHRPVVPIPDDLKLNPQRIEETEMTGFNKGGGRGTATETVQVDGFTGARLPAKRTEDISINGRSAQQMVQIAPGVLQSNGNNFTAAANSTGFAPATTSVSNAITSGESGVEAAAQGEEVGELFEYRIEQPVTVNRNRSALIPIIQTKLEGERVTFYNEAVNRNQRPMNSIRLKNISKLTLEGGAVTVIDGDAYAGEALMDRVKPNEQRFIAFALDLGTVITTKFKSDREPVFLVKAANGIFETHYYQIERKTYTIINQRDKKRTVYIEHPYREGWKLSDATQKPASRTLNHYRFRVELEPRATVELPITETQALQDSYQISQITRRDIEIFVSRKYIDDATKAELDKLLELQARISGLQAKVEKLDEEAEAIDDDQKRLRENIDKLKNTPEAKQLITRYIAKADAQETRLEQIDKEKKAAEEEQGRLQIELSKAVREFKFDRKL